MQSRSRIPNATTFTHSISQFELRALFNERRMLETMLAEIADNERSIMEAIEEGAEVEPGLHSVAIRSTPEGINWRQVLLQTKGQSFVEIVERNLATKKLEVL